jgi:hypothetical protein
MKGHGKWKAILGTLLAGALVVGCFAPVVYGVYKVYERDNEQVITLLVNQPPDKVWAEAVTTVRENQTKITKLDDKERYLEGVRKDGLEGSARVITGPEEKGSALVITLKKGKDPAAERSQMIASVISVCSKMKIECGEQKPKK